MRTVRLWIRCVLAVSLIGSVGAAPARSSAFLKAPGPTVSRAPATTR